MFWGYQNKARSYELRRDTFDFLPFSSEFHDQLSSVCPGSGLGAGDDLHFGLVASLDFKVRFRMAENYS